MIAVKNKLKRLLIIILLLLKAGVVFAELNPGAGTSGSDLLKIGMGARTTALGDAFAGISDDPLAIHWNPAGITQIKNFSTICSYNKWLLDSGCGLIAYVHPLPPIGFFGASITYMDYGELEQTVDSFSPVDTFIANEMLLTLSYAYPEIIFGLSAGINVKIFRKTIDTYFSNSLATDLGVLYVLPTVRRNINAGLVLQNIGTVTSFGSMETADVLPFNIKAGIGWHFLQLNMHRAFLAVDLNKPSYNNWRVNIGSEYCFNNMFFARLGFKLNYDTDSISMGIGFRTAMSQLDYSFAPVRYLGPSHRISVSFQWGVIPGVDKIDYAIELKTKEMNQNKKRRLIRKGIELIRAGKYRSAIRKLKKALKIGPGPENRRIRSLIEKSQKKLRMLKIGNKVPLLLIIPYQSSR